MNQTWVFRTGLLSIAFGLLSIASVWANPPASSGDAIEINSYAGGQQYYIQSDSFKSVGGGKLQYQVTGDLMDGGGRRVSVNEVDCTTGQYRAPIEAWTEGPQGQTSDVQPGPPMAKSLTNRTQLYGVLKDACKQHAPGTDINW